MALTRSEHTLLASGHRWPATGERPKEPSVFLEELREILEGRAAARSACSSTGRPRPSSTDGNPALLIAPHGRVAAGAVR